MRTRDGLRKRCARSVAERSEQVDRIAVGIADHGVALAPGRVEGLRLDLVARRLQRRDGFVDLVRARQAHREAGMVAGTRRRAPQALEQGGVVDHQPRAAGAALGLDMAVLRPEPREAEAEPAVEGDGTGEVAARHRDGVDDRLGHGAPSFHSPPVQNKNGTKSSGATAQRYWPGTHSTSPRSFWLRKRLATKRWSERRLMNCSAGFDTVSP